MADLVGRVQRLLTSPKTEWDAIAIEPVDRQKLILSYVVPLSAAAAIAAAIGISVFGVTIAGENYKTPMGSALVMAVLQVVMVVVAVFILAFIIDALAPSFGAAKNPNQAFKLAAYWPTAIWIAGIFAIIPFLAGILSLVGLVYSLYLLFIGMPKLMHPAADKATIYTIATILVAILANLIIFAVLYAFMPKPV